jgi:hypothetical protein
MKKKRLLIIGTGKRMQTTALPVLEKLDGYYDLQGIYSKNRKVLRFQDEGYETGEMEDLKVEAIAASDLIYMAVTKQSVPRVLLKLSEFDVSDKDLLIETPVLLFKHFCYVDLLKKFRNVWVAEDCVALPCFDAVRAALDQKVIGDLREVEFFQSAYKYHGLAMLKNLLEGDRITRANRKKMKPHYQCRTFTFPGERMGRVIEPRDYDKGRFTLRGSQGAISDFSEDERGVRVLEPVVANDLWKGFRVGDVVSNLKLDEIDLMGEQDSSSSITSRMDDMKRVAFYRLLKNIHGGEGAYPLDEALDDMVIDYYLDKVGFYFANPLMSIKSGKGRSLLRAVTRVLSKFM